MAGKLPVRDWRQEVRIESKWIREVGDTLSGFKLHPRLEADCISIMDLILCRLLLMNNSLYPWCILVPRRSGIRDIHELSDEDQVQLIRESSCLSGVMLTLFGGEKMNVAALGNMVPQLHLHHIVRRTDDPAWPGPVWGHEPPVSYSKKLLENIRDELQKAVTKAWN